MVWCERWIEFEKLKDAGGLIRSAFDDERAVQFINEKRVDSIVTSTEKRIRILEEYALHFNGKSVTMSTEDNVKKNTAEDYLNR